MSRRPSGKPEQRSSRAGAAAGIGEERTWTVREVLGWTSARLLREQGGDRDAAAARLDAEVLLAHCLEVDRLRLYLDHDKPLSAPELAAYREAIRRRLTGEPVAYITGHREFWSLDFRVTPAVLTPRPESELLVEIALDHVKEGGEVGRLESTVVDVGTGSGVVAVTLAHECPSLKVHATDISEGALEVARDNAARHAVEVTFHQGDLLAALPPALCCDLVLANLPYVAAPEIARLMPEVSRFEPRIALDGGPAGLDAIRRLVPQAAARLSADGLIALEIAPEQLAAVIDALSRSGFDRIATRRDLGGHQRVVLARRGGR